MGRPIPPPRGATADTAHSAEYWPPAPSYYAPENPGLPPRPVPHDLGDDVTTRGLIPEAVPSSTPPVEEAARGTVTRPAMVDLPPTTDHDQDMLGLSIPLDGQHVEIRQTAQYSPKGAGVMIAPGTLNRRPPAQVWTDALPVEE